MKIRLVLLCITAVVFAATAGYTQDSPERQIRKAMDENDAAVMHKDADALNRIYGDDYFRISVTGKTQGKAETLKHLMNPDLKPAKLERSNVKIRFYGDVAVVTALVTDHIHTEWTTAVWVKRNGAWQRAVLQMTSTIPIPASEYAQ